MVDVPQIIATIIRNVPEAEARLRLNGKDAEIIEPVVCSTFEFHRAASDMGPYDAAPIKIRLAEDSEPSKDALKLGSVIEVARPAIPDTADEWTRLRIAARRTLVGLLVLTMADPDE